jgi:hypothetical protein
MILDQFLSSDLGFDMIWDQNKSDRSGLCRSIRFWLWKLDQPIDLYYWPTDKIAAGYGPDQYAKLVPSVVEHPVKGAQTTLEVKWSPSFPGLPAKKIVKRWRIHDQPQLHEKCQKKTFDHQKSSLFSKKVLNILKVI